MKVMRISASTNYSKPAFSGFKSKIAPFLITASMLIPAAAAKAQEAATDSCEYSGTETEQEENCYDSRNKTLGWSLFGAGILILTAFMCASKSDKGDKKNK